MPPFRIQAIQFHQKFPALVAACSPKDQELVTSFCVGQAALHVILIRKREGRRCDRLEQPRRICDPSSFDRLLHFRAANLTERPKGCCMEARESFLNLNSMPCRNIIEDLLLPVGPFDDRLYWTSHFSQAKVQQLSILGQETGPGSQCLLLAPGRCDQLDDRSDCVAIALGPSERKGDRSADRAQFVVKGP